MRSISVKIHGLGLDYGMRVRVADDAMTHRALALRSHAYGPGNTRKSAWATVRVTGNRVTS